jgi:hypothetical protein
MTEPLIINRLIGVMEPLIIIINRLIGLMEPLIINRLIGVIGLIGNYVVLDGRR